MKRRLLILPIALLIAAAPLLLGDPTPASANHSWGGYHWARTSNPFTLKLGDNVSSTWDPILVTTSFDWSNPTGGATKVLDTTIVTGGTNPRICRPTSGRVEVCNASYGNNGWLGLAQIWISGSHITQGAVKLNDTYFNTPTYNTSAWRNLVSCQEVGHTFGLAHQDEDFYNPNLGTCMDYTINPGSNQHPNAHDYEELDIIYAHLDGFTTVGAATTQARGSANAGGNSPSEWGQLVRSDPQGRPILYRKDLGGGEKVFTWVFSEHGRGSNQP